jgi:DNA-binding IscR family transcriptional regulator
MIKDLEYAMLLLMYLMRAGTASTATVAKNLNLKLALLNRVAKGLEGASLLSYKRGEGYTTLSKEITVYDVFVALDTGTNFLDYRQYDANWLGMERRSLKNYGRYFDNQFYKILDVKLEYIMTMQLQKEMYALERADEKGTVN